MLYRYAGSPEMDGGGLAGFKDSQTASDWARPALSWAVKVGVLVGDDSGALNPTGSATRAETAAMLTRFLRV